MPAWRRRSLTLALTFRICLSLAVCVCVCAERTQLNLPLPTPTHTEMLSTVTTGASNVGNDPVRAAAASSSSAAPSRLFMRHALQRPASNKERRLFAEFRRHRTEFVAFRQQRIRADLHAAQRRRAEMVRIRQRDYLRLAVRTRWPVASVLCLIDRKESDFQSGSLVRNAAQHAYGSNDDTRVVLGAKHGHPPAIVGCSLMDLWDEEDGAGREYLETFSYLLGKSDGRRLCCRFHPTYLEPCRCANYREYEAGYSSPVEHRPVWTTPPASPSHADGRDYGGGYFPMRPITPPPTEGAPAAYTWS